jgi:hypothetical protein
MNSVGNDEREPARAGNFWDSRGKLRFPCYLPFKIQPGELAVEAHPCEVLPRRIIAIQTMFSFNFCPYV